MISVRILAPDLVEVTVRPSRWRRLLGARPVTICVARWGSEWHWYLGCEGESWWRRWTFTDRRANALISRAFADADAQRRAETARNYQAAAQRGEYPIR